MVAQAILLPEGPHIVEEGLSTQGETVFFGGKYKISGRGKISFYILKMDVLRMKVRLKRNVDFIAFKSFPLSNHFCVVGSALGHHFDH